MSVGCPAADWRSAQAYAPLARCDRHGFAWEWLRRSPAYRSACQDDRSPRDDASLAGRFGLHRLEPPGIPWPEARPIWRRAIDDSVLSAVAIPGSAVGTAAEVVDVRSLNTCATCVTDSDGEHWLLADHGGHVRIDVVGGSLGQDQVGLQFHIMGYPHCHGQIAALQRLVALAELGRWPARNPPPERRAARWALILRVHDAMAAGASHREIAECLFDLGDLPRWRVSAPSWRRRVQRLTNAARRLAACHPSTWLSVPVPPP